MGDATTCVIRMFAETLGAIYLRAVYAYNSTPKMASAPFLSSQCNLFICVVDSKKIVKAKDRVKQWGVVRGGAKLTTGAVYPKQKC